jgi:hypothetical protein
MGCGALSLMTGAVLAGLKLLGEHSWAGITGLTLLCWHHWAGISRVISSWFREAGIAELSSLGCADSKQCVAMLRIMGRCALNLITGAVLVVLESLI